MKTTYKIYPGIGVARIGNSNKYYIGPESPSVSTKGPFKDRGKIKKQAARFRVYEFEIDEYGHEKIIKEIVETDSVKIDWDVHLANKKAASIAFPKELRNVRNPGYDQSKLVIEGRDSISGTNKKTDDIVGQIQFVKNNRLEGKSDVVLGHMETDDLGRLLVIGGNGISRSPLGNAMESFANNPGWYDDCCDGPVGATIHINGESFQAESSWVVVAPPAYAPDIYNVVTWYDQAKNIEVGIFNPGLNLVTPSFTNDIYPILRRASLLQWVNARARSGHGEGANGNFLSSQFLEKLSDHRENTKTRQDVFSRLVEPNKAAPGKQTLPSHPKQNMPSLFSGIDPKDRDKHQHASLTAYQYSLMEKWANGEFISDWAGPPPEMEFDQIPLQKQPEALNEAALSACIGGPFYPGIETTYIMALAETYEAPYRIDQSLPAGHMTELMALPWQADFVACGSLWWPAQRPVSVKTDSGFQDFSRGMATTDKQQYGEMVKFWNKLGFVVKDGDSYVEVERGSIP